MGSSKSKESLSPDEFDKLVKSTDFSSAEVEEWFQKFQTDFPRGHISKKEFKTLYVKMFPKGDADGFCDHIFRIYDMDGNGVISFPEFMTTLHVSARGTPEEKLHAAFRMYDADRNGFVTLKEITSILTIIYKQRKDANVRAKAQADATQILVYLDRDNDGKLKEEEFVNAANSQCPLIREVLCNSNS